MKATIDKAGRIVLPQSVRDELRLQPGDSLEVEASGEELRMKHVSADAREGLGEEDGLPVWRGRLEEDIDIVDAIRRDREERIESQS